jgi:transcriptional regulator with XRE-family HTH domain
VQDVRVGSLLRAVRIKRGWRQADLARLAGISRSLVASIESGRLDSTTIRTLRAVATPLGVTIDVVARWHGGDGDRLLNEAHTRLHEAVAASLGELDGWVQAPEVSFAIAGERGVIDILAFHRPTRSLLVIELKTELADLADLLAVTSRRLRLARQIAVEHGWDAATVSAWVVVADSPANRRLAARFASLIRSALPADGHAMRRWLARPQGSIAALSFWPNVSRAGATERFAPRRRVRRLGSRAPVRGSAVRPPQPPAAAPAVPPGVAQGGRPAR